MNVLMLGNGFDLNYKLLTKYVNFLNIVSYLSTVPPFDIDSVGDVVGAEKLQLVDRDVSNSYQNSKEAYDCTPMAAEAVNKLSALAANNSLFTYLLKSFNRDVGWIDFETEISVIIRAFHNFLKRENILFDAAKYPESRVDRYIIAQFAFFHQPANTGLPGNSVRKIIPEYVVEYPQGSGNKIIDKEKIITTLEKQLFELAEGLQVYLQCFVENVVGEMCKHKYLQPLPALMNAQCVVSFNYTNTYERVYTNPKVYHIHGNLNDRIILGVNPDEADELSAMDVSFLRFKKYFQRVILHTDTDYLSWITKNHSNMSLVVMGHSLDATDKDIIMQMFDAAKDITVLYYSEHAETSLVANLVKIYGKAKFDELRIKKRLRFMSQNAKYTDFAEDRQSKEMAAFVRTIGNTTII